MAKFIVVLITALTLSTGVKRITDRFVIPSPVNNVVREEPQATSQPLSPSPSMNETRVIYPNAILVSSNTYTTSDSPEKVVSWYKQYIKDNNYNLKTVINTTTNGETNAFIKATRMSGSLDIRITKDNTHPQTKIIFNY